MTERLRQIITQAEQLSASEQDVLAETIATKMQALRPPKKPLAPLNAHDLMRLTVTERQPYLAAMAAEAAEDYADDPELRAFFALDGEDWGD